VNALVSTVLLALAIVAAAASGHATARRDTWAAHFLFIVAAIIAVAVLYIRGNAA